MKNGKKASRDLAELGVPGGARVVLRPVASLRGRFRIPAWQRGYCWGKREVNGFLLDLAAFDDLGGTEAYCLQEIMVKREGEDTFALIDGQQRLVTLFLVHAALRRTAGADATLGFDVAFEWEGREGVGAFLRQLGQGTEDFPPKEGSADGWRTQEDMDTWRLNKAYQEISQTLRYTIPPERLARLANNLRTSVQVIWHEIGAGESGREWHLRQNLGCTEMTNGELIRALLLHNVAYTDLKIQDVKDYVSAFDDIEMTLSNDMFWQVLTGGREAGGDRVGHLFRWIAERVTEKDHARAPFDYMERICAMWTPATAYDLLGLAFKMLVLGVLEGEYPVLSKDSPLVKKHPAWIFPALLEAKNLKEARKALLAWLDRFIPNAPHVREEALEILKELEEDDGEQ